MKTLIAIIVLTNSWAQAETKFEQIQNLFASARAPQTIEEAHTRIQTQRNCVKFGTLVPNYTYGEEIRISVEKEESSGPLFPVITKTRIYFSDAELIMSVQYKEALTQQGLNIEYSIYSGHEGCSGHGSKKECWWINDLIEQQAEIRLTEQFVVFKQIKSNHVGYCW